MIFKQNSFKKIITCAAVWHELALCTSRCHFSFEEPRLPTVEHSLWKENCCQLDSYFQRLVQSAKILIGSLKNPGIPPLFSKLLFFIISAVFGQREGEKVTTERSRVSLTLFNEKILTLVVLLL